MESIEFTQQELKILTNLLYAIQLRPADAELLLPILKKLDSKLKPPPPLPETNNIKKGGI